MKRLGAKVIGLDEGKGKKKILDQKRVCAIKRSTAAVTQTAAITTKTCCKKAYIVAVRYTTTKTHTCYV